MRANEDVVWFEVCVANLIRVIVSLTVSRRRTDQNDPHVPMDPIQSDKQLSNDVLA